jgi:predicted RNase H-like nuclease (RuvC/YqgF family)
MIDRFWQWRNFILTICLSFILISLVYLVPTLNQPLLAQSDLSLKSDIISLESRLNRLEQEVTRLRSSSSPASRTTTGNPAVVDGQIIGRTDPLYSRLATLLIELKEEVRSLDRRLTEIEQATP